MEIALVSACGGLGPPTDVARRGSQGAFSWEKNDCHIYTDAEKVTVCCDHGGHFSGHVNANLASASSHGPVTLNGSLLIVVLTKLP